MNSKEILELRRRFKPAKSAITRIHGCYVNDSHEIVSMLDEPLGTMSEDEAEKYLSLLKKALSGKLGKNLIDIVFSTQQVAEGEEHRRLRGLRDAALKDETALKAFYQTVIGALELEGSYLILLAHDVYDVPYKSKDGESQADASDQNFSYLVCAVCPVKPAKQTLNYYAEDNEFHNSAPGFVVAAPELGFLFPAFDDRAANLYNALYYTHSPQQLHQEFIDGVFKTEAPLSAAEQRELFQTLLTEALGEECTLDVVQSLRGELTALLDQHAEDKEAEAPTVSKLDLSRLLTAAGVTEEKAAAFETGYAAQLGEAVVDPANLFDYKKFELQTPDGSVSIDPEKGEQVETRIIDGRKYLLLPVDGGVEADGVQIQIV